MKTISETFYKVTQPDGGGMYDICVGMFTSEVEAKKYIETLSKGWPSSVKKEELNLTLYDTAEEFIKSKTEKEKIKNKIAELQKQLESY